MQQFFYIYNPGSALSHNKFNSNCNNQPWVLFHLQLINLLNHTTSHVPCPICIDRVIVESEVGGCGNRIFCKCCNFCLECQCQWDPYWETLKMSITFETTFFFSIITFGHLEQNGDACGTFLQAWAEEYLHPPYIPPTNVVASGAATQQGASCCELHYLEWEH